LFKFLNSSASIEGTYGGNIKWEIGGAAAGFIIIGYFNYYLYNKFSPKSVEGKPSYPVVFGFYDSLQQKEYEKAWEFLSPEMQKRRWKDGVKQFVNGFENTQNIKLLAINFEKEDSAYDHKWVVYYHDETYSPVLEGLEKLGEKHVHEISDVEKKVNALRKQMTEKAINTTSLDNMTISELVTAIRGDTLRWYITNTDGEEKANKLLPEHKTVSRMVGKRVEARLLDKKWLIDEIDNIPYNTE
jgi:hypothetical protein